MFPNAPAKIKETQPIKTTWVLMRINFNKYQPIAKTAAILNKLSRYFPYRFPKEKPKAIPGFSIKSRWIKPKLPMDEFKP